MKNTLANQKQNKSITIKNSQLGEINIRMDTIVHFERGILGYDFLQRFAIVDIEECKPFLWCVAVDEPEMSFPIVEYKRVYPDYQFNLNTKDRQDLKLAKSDEFHLFFIVTVDEEKETVSANLAGPLVINPEKKTGAQIIVPNENYIVNYPIIIGAKN